MQKFIIKICMTLAMTFIVRATDIEKVHFPRPDETPVSTWCKKIDEFFPDDTSKKYEMVINLKAFQPLTLNGLELFFEELGKKQEVLKRISNLALENGTSHKFNKVEKGLRLLLSENPKMVIEYKHTGSQTPLSPEKGMKSISSSSSYKFHKLGIGHFLLEPSEDDMDNSSSFSMSDMNTCLLELSADDREQQEDGIKRRFGGIEDQNITPCPPFGLTLPEQIIDLEGNDVSGFHKAQKVHFPRPDETPVSTWCKKIDEFFPDDPSKKYEMVINLKAFQHSTLHGLELFFEELGKKQEVLKRISNLALENGTSHKFNKVEKGLQLLLSKNPKMVIEYKHTGTQTPLSPEKGMKSISLSSSYTFHKLDIGHFLLEPSKDTMENSSSFSMSDMNTCLQEIRADDREQQENDIKRRFERIEDQNITPWPPFGLTLPQQIIDLEGSDISGFHKAQMDPPFVIVSGMRNYNMQDLCQLLKNYTTIEAVRFEDSAMHVDDIQDLFPLMKTQLKIVDVAGAFEVSDLAGIPKAIYDLLPIEEKGIMLHFLFDDQSSYLEPLNQEIPNLKKHQQLFSIIHEYVVFLKTQEN